MTDNLSTVLLAGIGRGPFNAIAPVLDRRQLEIETAASLEEAVALACAKHFDLIIFDAEPDQQSFAEIVSRLRNEASASHTSSVLVIAADDAVPAARQLIGRGVNRVVTIETAEEVIEQHVADLLDIAPRAAMRFAARLSTVLDDGTIEAAGETSNLSLTGMLVQTTTVLEPGQLVVFEILAGDEENKVTGEAAIVRHATAERGGVNGIGVRFLEFYGDGRDRVAAVLAEAFVAP